MSEPCRWKLEGLLEKLEQIDRMQDRSFCFILGAGASVKSRIRSGGDLAREWAKAWHKRECLDGQAIEPWIGQQIGASDFTMADAARFYPNIFGRNFRDDPDSGYAALEDEMDGKEPSLGYSLLAEIMQHTRHKVVVTTNFDNLVADALAIHAHQHPLVVGHETLTGFVRPQMRRPLVAKIHRDLFLHPINDTDGTSELKEGWAKALRGLFQRYSPIVLGYGGNDGSLMGLLEAMEPRDINGQIYWCHHHSSPPSERINAVVAKLKGVLVEITDFDWFMQLLVSRLIKDFQISAMTDRMEALSKRRVEEARQQYKQLAEDATAKPGNDEAAAVSKSIEKAAQRRDVWFVWALKASFETNPDKREAIYREGISHCPGSPSLLENFALFLQTVRGDMGEAERLFLEAIAADPRHANSHGNYARLLIFTNREAMAQAHIDAALRAAGEEDTPLRLECWFYRYAVAPEWREQALAEVEALLSKGVRSPGWDLSGVVARAKDLGHPDPERLDALAAAISAKG